MKRREFLGTVGLGAAAAGMSGAALAAEDTKKAKKKYPKEARSQIYYCEVCGAVAEILEPGRAPIVHCGVPMKLLDAKTEGPLAPMHVPIIDRVDGGYKVSVGKVLHPMIPSHFIGFIDLICDGRVLRQYRKPGEEPIAVFQTDAKEVSARAWCNLHGLWKSK
jgi:superoxide reductase